MEKSHEILSGDWNKTKANSIWIWGAGRKTTLPKFTSLHGLVGSVISAVDLNRGIAKCADMKIVDVEGATGRMDTNFEGKADAAIAEFESGTDFVYLHIEAPDEASHKGDAEEKIAALEMVDTVVQSAVSRLDAAGERYRLLIVPDHRTPIRIRTHSHDPVPFLIYDSEDEKRGGGNVFSEKCGEKGKRFESGKALLKYFLGE
jgi:2,3-bisphosphoglycerate-independent phosphoglycerate mutase